MLITTVTLVLAGEDALVVTGNDLVAERTDQHVLVRNAVLMMVEPCDMVVRRLPANGVLALHESLQLPVDVAGTADSAPLPDPWHSLDRPGSAWVVRPVPVRPPPTHGTSTCSASTRSSCPAGAASCRRST